MTRLTLGGVLYQVRSLPCRVAFGNESGIRQNVRGRRRLASMRRHGRAHEHPDHALGDGLRAQGFALAGPVDRPEALRAVQAATWLCDEPSASVAMGGRIPESVRYVLDPLARVPELRDLLTPAAVAVIRGWFGSEFRVRSVRFWRIASLPEAEQGFHHYGNLWHVDSHPLCMLKMFVQVDRATADGSALRLLPRPATTRVMRVGYFGPTRVSRRAQRIIDQQTICFDGPPGTVLFADTNRCLHRAGVPAEGETRAMVQYWLEPADAPPPDGDYFAGMQPDPGVHAGSVA